MERQRWRLITKEANYVEYLAKYGPVTAKAINEDKVPDTLAFLYPTEPALCLFRYQDALMDIHYEECKRNRVVVGRSPLTAGGVIYTEPEMQVVMFQALWDIRRHPEIPIMHELFYNNLFCRVADVVSERYKIPMRYRSLNDLELWDSNLKLWRKVAPAAMAPMGNAQLTGIALICGKPSDLMNRCLASPRDKYADKVIKEASLRNWNIEEAGAWPSGLPDKDQILKEQMDMILEAWRRAFGPIEYEIGEYTEGEEREGEAIYRFFTSEENIFARSPEKKFAEIPEGTSLGKHSEKVIGGPLIRAYVLRRGDMIEDVMLSGTVHLAPAETFEEIEKELKGCKMDESIIRERVEAAWKRLNAALGMGSASLVAETIVKACKEAK